MKILTTSREIESTLERLVVKSRSIRWAVAWASSNHRLFRLLEKHRKKIAQLTVGIHFYQTDPKFIESFIDHADARFIMNPDGVFHPKLYFFDFEDGGWQCVLGSPNFTKGALSSNSEIAVHLSSSDKDASESRARIEGVLKQYREQGKQLSPIDLERYRSISQRQRRKLQTLSGIYTKADGTHRKGTSPLEIPLFVQSWGEYFATLKRKDEEELESRLKVLDEARRLFAVHGQFHSMPIRERQGIAGTIKGEALDWLWFGSMKGAGLFQQSVKQNNRTLSDALEEIPFDGDVSANHYKNFIRHFIKAFQNPGIATGTRLLAMKRPDYFVCLDSKNKRELCKAFGIGQNVTLESYWEEVVERITESNWWASPSPNSPFERRIWECRAAFLDALYYDP